MSNKIKDKQVQYNAYDFEDSAKAQKLKNSKGTEQSRLHLLAYEGIQGKDKYAVAASIMGNNDSKKLGWLDKKYYVLHEHDNGDNTSTWYKINKKSLVKRLGIDPNDLKIDEKTGICTNVDTFVDSKKTEFQNWKDISNASTPFEEQFLKELVGAGISSNAYQKVLFCPTDSDKPLFGNELFLYVDPFKFQDTDLRGYSPGSILMINYNKNKADDDISIANRQKGIPNAFKNDSFFLNENSDLYKLLNSSRNPFNMVSLDSHSYEKINSGQVLKKAEINQITTNNKKTPDEIYLEELHQLKTRAEKLLSEFIAGEIIQILISSKDVNHFYEASINDQLIVNQIIESEFIKMEKKLADAAALENKPVDKIIQISLMKNGDENCKVIEISKFGLLESVR